MNPMQEVMKLEIEQGLLEKSESGGGCIYPPLGEWAGRWDITESQVLRELADLVEGGHIRAITVEICA